MERVTEVWDVYREFLRRMTADEKQGHGKVAAAKLAEIVCAPGVSSPEPPRAPLGPPERELDAPAEEEGDLTEWLRKRRKS